MSRIVRTSDAPTGTPAGEFPYSQAVVAGGLVFVSGQGPFDPESGAIVGDTIEEQTRQALRNVEAILIASGSSMAQVAHVLFLLANPDDFAGFNAEWTRWFPSNPPARSGAKHPLNNPNFRISLSVVAEARRGD